MSPAKKAMLVLGLPIGIALVGGMAVLQLTAEPTEAAPIPEPGPGQHGILLPLEERVINLQQPGGFRYAKIGVTIELLPEDASFYDLAGEARAFAEEEAIHAHDSVRPLLLDALGAVVSARDAASLTMPTGRHELKN
jgi:flagellar basal body-associated protein FliL